MTSREAPSDFPTRLSAGLQKCGFDGGRILVAVSGGADSVALLRGIVDLNIRRSSQSESPLQQFEIVVGHIDHQIREESIEDAKWVQSLADELGVASRIESADVLGRVAETQESLEEAARRTRYDTLVRIAEDEDCKAIAVAHTADDQAETVLHHLVRGTSVTGLRGMLPARPLTATVRLIRPMLDIRRPELEAWLREIRQNFRTDATNSDDSLTRNRIRHQLLPLLEKDFNPQVRRVLGTLADQAAELSNLLRSLADDLASEAIVQISDSSLRIDCSILADHPPVLIRETLLAIWQRAKWPLQRMGYREWQSLANLVNQDVGAVSLPERINARRRGQLIVLLRVSADPENALNRE